MSGLGRGQGSIGQPTESTGVPESRIMRITVKSRGHLRTHYLDCIPDIERFGLNPIVTNGLSYSYHLEESTFIIGASGVSFNFYFFFR